MTTSGGSYDPALKSGFPDAKYTTMEQLARPDLKTAFADGRQHYTNAKLANTMWTYALPRRLSSKQMTVVAFDPGMIPDADLAQDYNRFSRFFRNHVMPSPTVADFT
jgi:NAD(P)-dependent dehydrogenase (short-subunit alcohol dehydrogenase family)